MANVPAPGEKIQAGALPPPEALDGNVGSFLDTPESRRQVLRTYLGGVSLDDIQPRTFERDEVRELPREDRPAWGADLPPRDFWRINPWKTLFETPTDSRGLVDTKKLVTLGKITIKEGYTWDASRTRDDHLYWPYAAYARYAARIENPTPITFINLPSNRMRFPLAFERWKHAITIPADFPSLEVMHYSIEAWQTAHRLFINAHRAVLCERWGRNREASLQDGTNQVVPKYPDDRIAKEYIADTLAAHFKGVAIGLERHQKVPPEFQIIQPHHTFQDILRVMGYQARNRCRDGVKAVLHAAA